MFFESFIDIDRPIMKKIYKQYQNNVLVLDTKQQP